MGSSKKSHSSRYMLSMSPFLYINDPTIDTKIVSYLCDKIPQTRCLPIGSVLPRSKPVQDPVNEPVYIFVHDQAEDNGRSAQASAGAIREFAIASGRNFASINLCCGESDKWTNPGPNHLDVVVADGLEMTTPAEMLAYTEEIYAWLFTVLTVKDTLYLYSDEQMRHIDPGSGVLGYEYCPIAECSTRPKDAKVQFVVLIISKPEIVTSNKLTWQVADKSGVANFYFAWRDSSSQSTWDWVLSLEPGQRKCLPRMPYVLVKERLAISILKAPVRVPGVILAKTGNTIRVLGGCLKKIGRSMRLGRRERWVPEEDLVDYLDTHPKAKTIVASAPENADQVIEGKEAITWSDDHSSYSTLQDEYDEKW